MKNQLETLLREALALLQASPTQIVGKGPDLKTALIEALVVFFREVKKGDFAKAYGCTPNHISRLLNGSQEVNFYKLSEALHTFGYGLRIEITTVEIVRL